MAFTNTTCKVGPTLVTALPQTIPTTFPFQAGADLLVLDAGPTSAPYDPALVLQLGSDYTVTGGGYDAGNNMQTGSVVVVSGGANNVQVNDHIVIMRGVTLDQAQSFLATGYLTIALLEQALDKQATLAQQINELASRCLQFENFEFLSGIMPLNQRKGQFLMFDPSTGAVAFSPSGVASIKGIANGSYTLNVGTINGGASATSASNTFTGVVAGDNIIVNSTTVLADGIIICPPVATATNTISFKFSNITGSPIVVGTITLKWVALQF